MIRRHFPVRTVTFEPGARSAWHIHPTGQEVIPAPSGYQLFTPIIDTYLKEHLFADIFARDNNDHQSRQIVTISALASMTGTALPSSGSILVPQ